MNLINDYAISLIKISLQLNQYSNTQWTCYVADMKHGPKWRDSAKF